LLIIGEKINGTIPAVREAIQARDRAYLGSLATSQAGSGADYIDVNVAVGAGEDEADTMAWAIGVVRSATDKPLAVDSADPAVLARGLELCEGSMPFVNSANGEESRLESVLPLAAEHSCRLVALAMDESGIPETAGGRLEVALRIVDRAVALGVPPGNIYLDPLALPISADCSQGEVTLETLRLIKAEIPGVNTVMGLSNVSFGLPRRSLVNRAMLSIAAYIGLDAVMIDPTDRDLVAAALTAEAVAGRDRYCRQYMKAFRSGMIG
jgi:5-methyltetrahydrofolate corrinoid/iron sulfur protein methyltransferase